MSLQGWCKNGWLRKQEPNYRQIVQSLEASIRDVEASQHNQLPLEWQFSIAYNAVSSNEAESIIKLAQEIHEMVVEWMKREHQEIAAAFSKKRVAFLQKQQTGPWLADHLSKCQ